MIDDADALVARIAALERAVEACGGVLDADRLAPARALIARAGQRLARSREHTVVALAGATGGGKSSLFNALAGLELSDVGLRRPTTGHAHACVWGGGADAGPLLDWLGVPPRLRFDRESALDAEDEATLRGLVLLDLPDLDSLAGAHRTEAERLLELVDLVVWVTDPQKYADRVVHERYLRTFGRHREITVVVLNQADRLSTPDVERCVADLRRLLVADGLDGVPVLPVSAAGGPAAVVDLRGELEKAVSARQAQLQRLDGDLRAVVAGLSDAGGPAPESLDDETVREYTARLCQAAGAPVLVDTAARAYGVRGRRVTGWPPARYWRRPAPAPEATDPHPAAQAPSERADRPAVRLATRDLAERAAAGMPPLWAEAVSDASRSRLDGLPAALDAAVDGVGLRPSRTPIWWRLADVLQWLLVAAATAAVGWLIAGFFVTDLGGPALPALVAAGALLAGLVLALLARPMVAAGAKRAGQGVGERLASAVGAVAGEYVVEPVRAVVARYDQARASLAEAGR